MKKKTTPTLNPLFQAYKVENNGCKWPGGRGGSNKGDI